MRISVDQSKCCGSGMCVLTDPDLFDQSEEDGTVVLLQEHPDAEHQATAKEAAGLCPAGTGPSDHAPVIVDLDVAPDGDIGPVVPPPSAPGAKKKVKLPQAK